MDRIVSAQMHGAIMPLKYDFTVFGNDHAAVEWNDSKRTIVPVLTDPLNGCNGRVTRLPNSFDFRGR